MTDSKRGAPVRFGPFVLDLADERLVGAVGPIHIGNKAYRVLSALIEQPGRLLTKDILFETVWDGTIVSESSLTSVIKELRRALGDEAKEPRFIESVYGRGYRFIADTLPARAEPAQPAKRPATAAGKRGEAPTLAVLPFTNRSGISEDEVFAEGMVEDVIAALSQGVNVTVLGSTVTAGLRGEHITDLAALGQRLGVHYLLEGNIRRAPAHLRVTAQILEAATGVVRWSGRFERPLSELAALQEDLVSELAASLDVQVQSLELQRILKKPSDITAWEALMRSNAFYHKLDRASLQHALAEAQHAVALAPDYAAAHAQIALASAVTYLITSADDPAEVERIAGLVERAVGLEPDDPLVLAATGCALNYIGRPEEASHLLRRAISKAPGHSMAHYHFGVTSCLLDRHDDALAHLETAIRLFAGSPLLYLTIAWKGGALVRSGRWAEGEAQFDEALALNPRFVIGRAQKAVCLARRGDEAAALAVFEPLRGHDDYRQEQCETMLRRIFANSPAAADMLAGVRRLWAKDERRSARAAGGAGTGS